VAHDDGFDADTPEERVAALVDQVKQDPRSGARLVALLPERLPLYAGRSRNAVVRMRGYVIAAFEQVGLPEPALPYVLEELESGRDAYLVAAAARALRGLGRPTARVVPFLLQAIENIEHADDAVSFDSYRPRWPAASRSTAVDEIMTTFAWLGEHAAVALPRLEALAGEPAAISEPAQATLRALLDSHGHAGADCCAGPPDGPVAGLGVTTGRGRDAAPPSGVELEDQNGRRLTFGEFFLGRPSVVVFFYTRCDNPNKCSLTITKLARLQLALRQRQLQGQVGTAAITYDPDYDRPPRLRSYGENRGVVFGDRDRFLRATAGLAPLHDYFELGVNFGQALVNRHRIELFVLDRDGHIVSTFARLQWDVEAVLGRVIVQALEPMPHRGRRGG
jgi:cytochrome oxidase Cu insertion factor (SCO1/SenC/PrrC family)